MALPLASGVLTAKCSLAALLLVLVLVLSSSPAACRAAQVNITAILAAHPDLREFSTVLSSTRLADDISERNDGPVTVLAVNNAGMASLHDLPREAVWGNLSLHVLLDCYYDDAKLRRLPFGGSGTLVSTLYSDAGGGSPGVFGKVKIVKFSDGRGVGFLPMGSHAATPAFFVKSVYAAPDSISVLQVSGVMTPGIPDDATNGDADGDETKHDDGSGTAR